MKYFRLIIVFLFVGMANHVLAQFKSEMELGTTSPNRELKLFFQIDTIGTPRYSIQYKGREVISSSKMGLELSEASLCSGFQLIKTETASFDETWKPVYGEQDKIRNQYHQVDYVLRSENGNQLSIIFRLFNDGFAFRYVLPGNGSAVVARERTEFHLAEDANAIGHAACWDNSEYHIIESKLSEMDEEKMDDSYVNQQDHAFARPCRIGFNTPVSMETESGIYLAIHEAALWNYPGMSLELDPAGRLFISALAGEEGKKASVQLPFRTPWRMVLVSDDVADLVESNMVLNLNEPCKLEDVSWIQPMKFTGIWWEMHVGKSSWDYESGNHGANTANAKRYIDFAATNNIQGLLIEGWNKTWVDWIEKGNFNYTQPYPDFDIDEIVAYGKQKGVQLIGHHETGANVGNYIKQMIGAYIYYQNKSVNYVKTGYVGHVKDHMHYDQFMVNHYNETVVESAKHKINLDIHEPIKPTGITRTYPNLMTGEGMRGQEFNAWSEGNDVNHNIRLVFTRALAGPMDFTPGIFDLLFLNSRNVVYNSLSDEEKKDFVFQNRVRTTLAHQLALYVVYYSPMQMVADLPENYEGQEAFQFIKDVPVDWSASQVVEAKFGQSVVLARKEKHSDNWYVGGITNELEREVEFRLDFLEAGKDYEMIVYRDAETTNWKTEPTTYKVEHGKVSRGRKVKLKMASGGGFAIALRAE